MTDQEALVQQWASDPEGRALVAAILDKKDRECSAYPTTTC